MEDKKISEMAELLFRGAKMLSHHCPECGAPLFQDGNRIFCPSCGRDVIFESDSGKEGVKVVENAEEVGRIDIKEKVESEVSKSENVNASIPSFSPVETKGSGMVAAGESLDKALFYLSRSVLKLCRMIEEENNFSLLEKKVKTLKELTESAERIIRLKEFLQ